MRLLSEETDIYEIEVKLVGMVFGNLNQASRVRLCRHPGCCAHWRAPAEFSDVFKAAAIVREGLLLFYNTKGLRILP